MTQQDIIYELNKMVIGYNITWDSIKYDADKAIMKINSYLGAEYPMMSEVMLLPHHRYTVRCNNKDIPIFPERYILTVVIPYIATEVLARDEEFTTIYNKYAMDVENGLFDMFQNEFNRVIPAFRQDPDVGVYFDRDTPDHNRHIHKHKLPKLEYSIYYHMNQDTDPVVDLVKYPYGSEAICKKPNVEELIKNITAYKFKGWSLNPNGDIHYEPLSTIENIISDVHLYAVWEEECVILNDAGTISIKDDYKNKLTHIVIPTFINGTRVSIIDSNFSEGTTLKYVALPRTDLTIKPNAFNNLEELILPAYDYLRDYPRVHIKASAILNMSYLYIPYSVSTIVLGGILKVDEIQCEIERKPVGFEDNWTDAKVEWGVVNHG